jgi:hypothetical protein
MRGWDLTRNRKLKKIIFGNSSFYFERNFSSSIVPNEFPGGNYQLKISGTGHLPDVLVLTLSFPENPDLCLDDIEGDPVTKVQVLGNIDYDRYLTTVAKVNFNLPSAWQKQLQEQLDQKAQELERKKARFQELVQQNLTDKLIILKQKAQEEAKTCNRLDKFLTEIKQLNNL